MGLRVSCRPITGREDYPNLALSLVDMSQTGARVRVRTSLIEDQLLNAEFSFPPAGIQVLRNSKVVWCAPLDDGSYWIGIQFDQPLSQSDLQEMTSTHPYMHSGNPEDNVKTTVPVGRKQLLSNLVHEACLVHIYPRGPEMGMRYTLDDEIIEIGRDPVCQIRMSDQSVSRKHAAIRLTEDGFEVEDLNSTNGTFINEICISKSYLQDGDYLHIGQCIFRFLAGGNIEADYHEEIYRLTIIDALTNIPNQRCLLEFLDREMSRSNRYKRPVSVIIFDLDRFKETNNRLGHLGGDFTLKELAALVKKEVRKEELLARFGGEEFVVVLPETEKKQAMEIAERIRILVEENDFIYEGRKYRVTISAGVHGTDGQGETTSAELLEQADSYLYQAKAEGRNRVIG